MSNLASLCTVSFGKHASTTDFTTAAVSMMNLPVEKHSFLSPDTVKLRRMPTHTLNKGFAPFRGHIDVSKSYAVEQLIRGLSGNTGAAIDPETTTDIAQILDVAAGTASIDPAGAVTTATGGTGGTPNLTVTSGTNIPDGMVIMFEAPAGTYHVRQVRSGGGTGTLVLDRTYSGTVANGTNVVRMARWKFDPAVFEHVHGHFRTEYGDDRRDFTGGMCTVAMDFSVGAIGKMTSTWKFTNVADAAEQNPTFSEPVAGGGVVNVNNNFWIEDDVYYATDAKLECGGDVVPRKANTGPNGVLGSTVQKGGDKARPKLSLRLQRGTNTGEVADSAGNTSQNILQAWSTALGVALTTLDIALQVGGAAGACCYVVMPAAACTKCEEVIVDGMKMLDCEFEAMGPSSTTFAPLEFHLG